VGNTPGPVVALVTGAGSGIGAACAGGAGYITGSFSPADGGFGAQ
jgi:hypothetical protein